MNLRFPQFLHVPDGHRLAHTTDGNHGEQDVISAIVHAAWQFTNVPSKEIAARATTSNAIF